MTPLGAVLAAALAGLATLVPSGDPSWPAVLGLGLLGGVLVLDDTALAQTWFSQPLPAAVLAGAVLGDPLSGLALGLPIQLIMAGNLPVGQTSAVVASVGAAVLSGRSLSPALAADTRLPVALIGWLVVAVGLASMSGHLLVQAERRAHNLWMREGHRTLRDGRLQRVEAIHLRCLATTFLRGFAVTVVVLLVLRRVWLPLFGDLPTFVHGVLTMVPLLLPGLGLGNLAERYGLRTGWAWLAGGAALSFGFARYVL